ncbi:uncharacterized protein [Drosophila tropicalis]
MSNFCSPEKSGNIVGLQRSNVNQSVIEAEQARAKPLIEVLSQQQQKQQRQSKMPVDRTSCLASASGGNPYQMSPGHDQQRGLNNTTCCSGNNECTNLGIDYGNWPQQQQYHQHQPHHLCCQQQPIQLQQYQQQQPQYYHFQQQQHHHIQHQQQQQQKQHCLNNNESFNRFEPHLNSTMIGQESPRLPDTNCIQRPLANRSCMPQAQPYRPPTLRGAAPTPTPGPTATNTQRCNATYKPLPPSARMMQPPTPSNSCGQRMMGTPEMTQQSLRCDNRTFDETSYMQLPMPSKQQQQTQRQLPQSQCQPQVSFRNCPTSTPRPKTSTGSQCCTQPIQSQGPQGPPMAMNQSLPAQSSMCPSATSSPRGSRPPQTFEMSTFIEERSQSQINSCDMTPEERFVQRTKSLFFDVLVKDHTCPGVMQETLDGKEDFNAYAFEIAFSGNVPNKPEPIDPISILEALKLRIDYERTEIRKNHSANTSANSSDLEKPPKDQSKDHKLPRTQGQSSRDRSRRAPSEGKGRRRRSGVTEEDIDSHFASKNKSELNNAVCAFLQAEAEYRSTNVEGGRKDFEANVNAYEPKLMGTGIKTNAYTATTKPID